jgi:histidinol-phosphatase (PHP family)
MMMQNNIFFLSTVLSNLALFSTTTTLKLINYHTHSHFCDGSSEPEAYVLAALEMGFAALGFSAHAPLPFDNRWSLKPDSVDEYLAAISALKTKYAGRIDVSLGMEIDYIPGISSSFSELKEQYALDFVIGGVHLVKSAGSEQLWFIDGSPEGYDSGLADIFDNDIRRAVKCYFTQLWEMIREQKPDIIAHFDKIKMNNRGRYFSTDDIWYRKYLYETIRTIASYGSIVEVNTRGIYKNRSDELYPAVWILRECFKLGIPVTVSSDAHMPEELIMQVPETMQLLKEIGYKNIMMLGDHGWTELPL